MDSDLSGAESMGVYLGSERLSLMGNNVRDVSGSHVVRIWQVWKGVFTHNNVSGSSLDSDLGRHALKLHGPIEGGDIHCAGCLRHPTQYVVVANNVFGGSGPMPVSVGAQSDSTDERIEDVVVEDNRFLSSYGRLSRLSTKVEYSLTLNARYVTVRNNVFDGTGSDQFCTAVSATRRGVEPPPRGHRIFNNSIYKMDAPASALTAITIGPDAVGTLVKNNLAQFGAAPTRILVADASGVAVQDHNALVADAGYVDPANPVWGLKDFRLTAGSPAAGAGSFTLDPDDAGHPAGPSSRRLPVFDDIAGNARTPLVAYDLGAYVRGSAFGPFLESPPAGPVCGNAACESGETAASCPADCAHDPGGSAKKGGCSSAGTGGLALGALASFAFLRRRRRAA